MQASTSLSERHSQATLTVFKAYSPGSVVSDFSHNASTVENGLSEAALGVAIQAASTVVASAVVAFTQCWKLTLVTSTTIVALFAYFHAIRKWEAISES